MNKIYKVIYSKNLGCLVVVSESAKCAGGKKTARRKLVSLVAASSLLSMPVFADNLPTGGQVVSGAASISSNGSAMTVNQSTDKMIANWQSFSIGAGNSVTFNQPNVSSVALNRVVGQDTSQILGNLNANGQVFLINPNGVAIGASGSVQTGGFIASTLDITNENFLSGNYQFTGIGGSISNKGNISGRIVALIAPSVTNEGSINYSSTNTTSSDSVSSVALAAGTDVLLDFDGDGLLSVEVKANTLASLVENKGLIQTDGGIAILTAKGASDALKGVVNNSGMIQANTIASQNGRILLLGDMSNGEVIASGSLEANFVETSAATVKIDKDLKVATNGGEWLIDPVNITVDSAMATATQNSLTTGDVTITTAGAGTDEGNITVDASIDWSAHTLTLRADNDITINAELTSTGTTSSDGLMLQYAQTTSTGDYSINAPVNLAAGSLFQTKKGSDTAITYTVITSLGSEGSTTGIDLQGINSGLTSNYVLGANIDASQTGTWGSSGFAPIGGDPTRFTGILDGLGHTINDLTIYRPSEDYAGLFGRTSGASIQNIGLVDASITGNGNVGGLVGYNESSTISNAYVTGSVTAGSDYFGSAGGLVGVNNRSNISYVYATSTVSGNDLVGGLVGHNYNSTISNAYATGSVSGNDRVGGLAGVNGGLNGIIRNAYATGTVSGTSLVGGLLGSNSGAVSNSYWDIDTTGRTSSAGGGTGLTTPEALLQSNYSNFDFNDWFMVDGQTRPFLRSEYSTTIQNTHQLQLMAMDLTADYTLAQHLNFGTIFTDANRSDMWATSTTTGKGFVPVGAAPLKFTGKFDGLGYTITDLTIDRSATNYVGLFGITNGATIRNVGLIGGSVTGRDAVGGLVGRSNSSTITNAYATGRVTGSKNYVGGLVGLNESTTVTNAYTTGSVSGLYFVGGLVGYNDTSTISNTYATGSVTGAGSGVGGLVGRNYNSGSITFAYATGSVTGSSSTGGLIGDNLSSGTVTDSFWNTQTTGQVSGIGTDSNDQTVIGLTTAQTQDPFTFIDAAWNFSSTWGKSNAGENNSYMMLRGVGPAATLYDNYVALSGDTSKTYGDANPATPGFTANSLGEENVTLGWGSAITATTNAGDYLYSAANVLNASGNTYVDYGAGALTINKAVISAITGITASNKTYDGNISATLDTSGSAFTGMVSGDDLTVASASGAFADKNAEANKTVTVSGLELSGTDAGNYTLSNTTAVTTADIAKAVISAITGITAANKTYDGSTTATLDTDSSAFTGMVSGDDLTVASASGSFTDKNAAENKTVTVSGLNLSGDDAANYSLASTTAVTTADIAKAVISAITGITASNKTYDGNISATLDTSGSAFTGMVSGDDLTVASASGAFTDKNAGTSKTVTVSGLSLSGTDAANYSLVSTTAVTTADIAKAVISAITGITANNKTYDGSTTATLDSDSSAFTGMVSGDDLTVASASGAFADNNYGTNKMVSIFNIRLGGADASNYILANTSAVSAADILPVNAPIYSSTNELPIDWLTPSSETLNTTQDLIQTNRMSVNTDKVATLLFEGEL